MVDTHLGIKELPGGVGKPHMLELGVQNNSRPLHEELPLSAGIRPT